MTASRRNHAPIPRTGRRLTSARLGLGLVMLLGLASGACSDADDAQEDTKLAFSDEADASDTTFVAERPYVAPEDEPFVALEATWMCDLQTRAFDSPADIDIALTELLDQAGLAREDYDQFRAQVNERKDLRDAILYTYQEDCWP